MQRRLRELTADRVAAVCDSGAMEVLELQRFYALCQEAVADYNPQDDPGIPLELGRQPGQLSIYMEDSAELKDAFLGRTLPRYSVVLLVGIMESIFETLRKEVGWAHLEKSKGFGLPVPGGAPKDQVDAALVPLVTQYLELKCVRNILVHNRGMVDEQYMRRAAPAARANIGDEYPLSHEYCWQSFRNSLDLITVYELLWHGRAVIRGAQSGELVL